MPTLQDVAELAGVSTATVSKVLSNTPYFSEETRIKVMRAVEEIGYRPNLAARALSSGKTNIIAVVFPYIYDAIFKDPLVMHILEGVEIACNERQYNMLLSTPRLDDGYPDDHYMRLLQSGVIEGLIAIDNVPICSLGQAAERRNIPAVVLGIHSGAYTVRSDEQAGGACIMEHVLRAGHERIGIITVQNGTNLAIELRIAGMKAAAEAAGFDFDAMPFIRSDFSTRGGATAARELLQHDPDLTAIISVNDRMAIGAMTYLQQIGKRVPDDISVTGYDNIAISAVSNPPLTTIDQQAVELGKQAAALLFRRLQGEAPSSVVLQPSFVQRASLAVRR
jgi:LacI family transcriptional regulator